MLFAVPLHAFYTIFERAPVAAAIGAAVDDLSFFIASLRARDLSSLRVSLCLLSHAPGFLYSLALSSPLPLLSYPLVLVTIPALPILPPLGHSPFYLAAHNLFSYFIGENGRIGEKEREIGRRDFFTLEV